MEAESPLAISSPETQRPLPHVGAGGTVPIPGEPDVLGWGWGGSHVQGQPPLDKEEAGSGLGFGAKTSGGPWRPGRWVRGAAPRAQLGQMWRSLSPPPPAFLPKHPCSWAPSCLLTCPRPSAPPGLPPGLSPVGVQRETGGSEYLLGACCVRGTGLGPSRAPFP